MPLTTKTTWNLAFPPPKSCHSTSSNGNNSQHTTCRAPCTWLAPGYLAFDLFKKGYFWRHYKAIAALQSVNPK